MKSLIVVIIALFAQLTATMAETPPPSRIQLLIRPAVPIIKRWVRLTCVFEANDVRNPEKVEIVDSNGYALGSYDNSNDTRSLTRKTHIGWRYRHPFSEGSVVDVIMNEDKTNLTLVVSVPDVCKSFRHTCLVYKDGEFEEVDNYAPFTNYASHPGITFNRKTFSGKTIAKKHITDSANNEIRCFEVKSTQHSGSENDLTQVSLTVWINNRKYYSKEFSFADRQCFKKAMVIKNYLLSNSDHILIECEAWYRDGNSIKVYAKTPGMKIRSVSGGLSTAELVGGCVSVHVQTTLSTLLLSIAMMLVHLF